MLLFGVDLEAEAGIPEQANVFAQHIDNADLLLISLAENNGSYSVAFKNIFDWVSRISGRSVFESKPIFLMATSPGGRGGSTVLAIAEKRFPFNGGVVLDTFSLPSFRENFAEGQGITHEVYKKELMDKVEKIKNNFSSKKLF